ncbi:hypothetical protein [Flavobacterium branchiicola]|uniref:HNH nuclease domain-containing protein n=1 Tax=Flavobacterium branchiicola TaxID=1114875 RepID=A0ABV9PFP2_9FLAO|nr:hypothetical protein [Flavobacterium branchiicola]MBS7255369.1 hypothetical protein [Flavobacterium branchiicola]
MKKIKKDYNSSKIITDVLQYNCKKGANNSVLGSILLKEQKSFCAYSEEFIDPISDSNDIEHFNPDFKCSDDDSYSNWFKVKNKVNFRKRLKELEFQKKNIQFDDILQPCGNDFEEKLKYIVGEYRFEESSDIKVKNLIDFLELNIPEKIEQRRDFIVRKRKEIEKWGDGIEDFFKMLIEDDIRQIKYLRAIQEEFGIDIWNMIPEIE